MIPTSLVRFLERANVGHIGTRDAQLVPYGDRVSGWVVSPDARTVTVLVASTDTARLVASLEENGHVALTVEEYPAHEAYQLKGRYLAHRPVRRQDGETAEQMRQRFVRALKPFYPPEAEPMMRAYTQAPTLAVEFEVQDIFVQTPGPGAGARLGGAPA